VTTPPPSRQADEEALDHELASAERRGADRVRAQVRDVLAEARRIVRLGEHQIEVVEVAALAPLLDDDSE
jgi:hypothetical protein